MAWHGRAASRSSYPSSAEQQISQQVQQPKHANELSNCVSTMAHWSFTLEHAWIQHMQQHFWHIFPQQLDAAFAKTSAATGVAPIIPAGVFAAVAVRLPKPKPRFWSIILFSDLGSSVFCLSVPCYGLHLVVSGMVRIQYNCS